MDAETERLLERSRQRRQQLDAEMWKVPATAPSSAQISQRFAALAAQIDMYEDETGAGQSKPHEISSKTSENPKTAENPKKVAENSTNFSKPASKIVRIRQESPQKIVTYKSSAEIRLEIPSKHEESESDDWKMEEDEKPESMSPAKTGLESFFVKKTTTSARVEVKPPVAAARKLNRNDDEILLPSKKANMDPAVFFPNAKVPEKVPLGDGKVSALSNWWETQIKAEQGQLAADAAAKRPPTAVVSKNIKEKTATLENKIPVKKAATPEPLTPSGLTPEPPKARGATPEPQKARGPTAEPQKARRPTPEPQKARVPTPEPVEAKSPASEPKNTKGPAPEVPKAPPAPAIGLYPKIPSISEETCARLDNCFFSDGADETTASSEIFDDELDACLDEAINAAALSAAMAKSPAVVVNKSERVKVQPQPSTPLVYTVSMYRRMAKQQSTEPTQLKAVILPPASPRRLDSTSDAHHLESAQEYERRVKSLSDGITVQQEQIYQASRALDYCRNVEEFRGSSEEVDAHKALLIAGEKRKALQQELERLRECRRQRIPSELEDAPLGTLTFQYISLSLKREFVNERISHMGDYVFYFICILKYRDQLLTTQFVNSDAAVSAGGRVEFTNYFQFKNLPHDFNVEISVFALQAKREEMSHEQKYKLNGQTIKHKQRPASALLSASAVSLGGPGAIKETNFKLVGQINLTLGSVERQKFQLQGFQLLAPIEPFIHIKTRCCADSVGTVEERGFLGVYEEVSHLGSWHRRWCTLKDGALKFWRYPDEETTKAPMATVDLVKCTTKRVEPVSLDVCTRPHTFALETYIGDSYQLEKHLFSADNKEEFLGWCEKLNLALYNLRLWNVDPHHVHH